jgi:GTP-binding protein
MKINSAQLVARVTTGDDIPEQDFRHVAFIGRSNVGKSSVINTITSKKDLAKSSSTPGFTKSINFYLINKSFFLVDLPGYGFAQGSVKERKRLQQLIEWYLTYPDLDDKQLIVMIVDAKVGVTELDRQMFTLLNELEKRVVVVANKIDKLKKNDVKKQIAGIMEYAHPYQVIPFSTVDKIGIGALTKEIFDKSLTF